MQKNIFIALGIGVLVIASVAYVILSKNQQPTSFQEPVQQAETAKNDSTTPAAPAKTPGSYVEYKDGVIDQAAGTRLLFFYASWCPQCRALDADIKKRGVPDGVTIIKVDFDANQALRQKYGVTMQTTVVRLDSDGNLAKKFVAYNEPSLQAVLDSVLPQ
ncbi:MAG TPA: thioredoxin family protein [Candidatus Saccharimonadales bacterium]|nr:thioredoxin family protein [Candidatus Saccharimonadales bacterium]